MTVSEADHNSEIKKLSELMKGIRFAMFTTVEEDGTLHSRPMATQEVEFDGDLWFFTHISAPKVWETQQHRQVSVTFEDPGKNKFISTSGVAQLILDREKMQQLWKPALKVFFGQGLEDPDLGLIKVSVEKAEYWDSAPTALGRAFNFAKAYITKDASSLGDHAKLELK
jgi:general stress protein 26